MFRVYVNDQKEAYPLYEPLDDTLHIFDPVLTQEMGCGGYFKFSIFEGHPYAGKIGLLKSEIIVYNNEKEIFRGRVLRPEYTMQRLISVSVEGDLAYLIDSQQKPYEFTGNIPAFIGQVLEAHNSQVDDYKKIHPGIITVTDDTYDVTRSETRFSTTLETLKSKVVEQQGGYLRIRNEGGRKYLDYLWDYGGINEQVIRFGENLLDINRCIDATAIFTRLIPIGADVEYTDALGEKQVKSIDITSANGGSEYIQSDAAIELYGKITGVYTWNDVTEPEVLLEKAKEYLKEATSLPDSMEIKAIDLSLIDKTVPEFELGYWTCVSSEPHGIERKLLLRKRVINLLNPTAGSIELGNTKKTFTDQVAKNQQDMIKAIQKTASNASQEINRVVENATNLITGSLGGYVILDTTDPVTGETTHPWRILVMNTPDKDTAKNVIQINQNGLGFSTTGINGPYRNAWTIDGNLVADFITAGTMLADRIRGGILEVGGSGIGRDGKIVVKDVNDKQIGYWDKTGLHVMLGVLEGTDIIGGTIDIGDGTFQVSRDGSVSIESGEISIGPVSIDDNIVDLGGYRVASGQYGVLYSKDKKIQLWSNDPDWNDRPMLYIGSTRVSDNFVRTKNVDCDDIYFNDTWTENMSALEMFKDLYDKIKQ